MGTEYFWKLFTNPIEPKYARWGDKFLRMIPCVGRKLGQQEVRSAKVQLVSNSLSPKL